MNIYQLTSSDEKLARVKQRSLLTNNGGRCTKCIALEKRYVKLLDNCDEDKKNMIRENILRVITKCNHK